MPIPHFIHCNQCFRRPNKDLQVFLTSCGHLFCGNCSGREPIANGICVVCKKAKISLCTVGETMKPETREFFSDTSHLVKKMEKIQSFQAFHAQRYVSHMEIEMKKLRAERIRLEQKLVKMEQSKNEMVQMQNSQVPHRSQNAGMGQSGSKPQRFQSVEQPQKFQTVGQPQRFQTVGQPQRFQTVGQPQRFQSVTQPQIIASRTPASNMNRPDLARSRSLSRDCGQFLQLNSMMQRYEPSSKPQPNLSDNVSMKSSEYFTPKSLSSSTMHNGLQRSSRISLGPRNASESFYGMYRKRAESPSSLDQAPSFDYMSCSSGGNYEPLRMNGYEKKKATVSPYGR